MKLAAVLVMGVLAISSTGCVARTAVVSVEKNAYVVKGSIFGTSMYHCKADGAKPTCTQVEEVE